VTKKWGCTKLLCAQTLSAVAGSIRTAPRPSRRHRSCPEARKATLPVSRQIAQVRNQRQCVHRSIWQLFPRVTRANFAAVHAGHPGAQSRKIKPEVKIALPPRMWVPLISVPPMLPSLPLCSSARHFARLNVRPPPSRCPAVQGWSCLRGSPQAQLPCSDATRASLRQSLARLLLFSARLFSAEFNAPAHSALARRWFPGRHRA